SSDLVQSGVERQSAMYWRFISSIGLLSEMGSGSHEDRAANGDVPLGAASGDPVPVGRRLVGGATTDFGADVLQARPDADREAGERGGAECRRLSFRRNLDGAAE